MMTAAAPPIEPLKRHGGITGVLKRSIPALVLAFAGLVALPAAASASNHLVKIREVYAGSALAPNSEYVELQMYAPGQNFFNAGTSLKLYDATGAPTETFVPSGSNPPNSANQQRVLFANSGAKTEFGVSAGYTLPSANAITDVGGAVCYTPTEAGSFIDCVSWGNFSGSLPSPTGGNVDPGGVADGKALNRSIAGGCSTLLEAGDDTNKPVDWSDVTPAPLNNASPPPEQVCPSTTFTKKPKAKTTDRTPTFKFKASVSGSTFKCKLDSAAFAACTSPLTTKKLKFGKHTLSVRATNSAGGAGRAAKASFKVIKKRPHHH
jgi:hypothetical protein